MTYFNPLIAPIATGSQVQRVAAADKERQVARAQALAKNSAADGDRFEHQVESPDATKSVGDEASGGGHEQPEQRPHDSPTNNPPPVDEHDSEPGEEEPRLDITA